VYACGVAKPGHGSFTPLIVGLTLWACAASGGKYSGAFLNPARVLGPVAVFKCGSRLTGLSILGQVFASLLSCGIFAFVSGLGPLHPLTSQKKLGLSQTEAIRMWMTGSPPARLSTPGREDENVIELLKDMDTDEEIPRGGTRSPRGAPKETGLSVEKV
jgi:Major intrinsic protein